MTATKTVEIPRVEQKVYCATCHAYLKTNVYPLRTVEIDADDEPNIPSSFALVHDSRCPSHWLT